MSPITAPAARATKPVDVPVDQYDLSGKLLRKFKSITEASQTTHISQHDIRRAMQLHTQSKDKRYSTGGYYWRIAGQNLGEIAKIPISGRARVGVRLVKEGEEDRRFNSQTEAAKFLGVPQPAVCQALRREGTCNGWDVYRG